MLSFSSRNATSRKLWDVLRLHTVQERVKLALAGNGGNISEHEFTEPTGKALLLHVAPLPGEPTRGAVLVFHDTTELRRLERMRQEFVANVSHELKTPLSVIRACVETLLDGGIDDVENRLRFLQRIQEESLRLQSLILDLLSLARIESGNQTWSFEPVPIAEVAQVCVERHQARADASRQALIVEGPPNGASVLAQTDAEALTDILDNLIDNALKYTPEGGTIRIRWKSLGNQCQIEVADTGIGIPAADLPRVFERFYRVDKARSRELGGTGLGLSIVKHLVQSMRGSIAASSEPGKGSTFTVILPAPAF